MKKTVEKFLCCVRKFSRLRLALVVVLLLPLLTGCWDLQEVEHLFYVNALGVDYQNGKFIAYVQVLNPEAIGKRQGGESQFTGAWIGRGEGNTLLAAVHDIYSTTQRRIFWGHTNSLIFSDAALQAQGIQQFLDLPTRYREFRYLPWVYSTHDSVSDMLKTDPILESTPIFSMISDPMDMYKQSSHIRPMRLFQIIDTLLEPARSSIIPELTIKTTDWSDNQENYPEPEISGVTVLHNGRMIGHLTRSDLGGLIWLTPMTQREIVSVREHGKIVAVLTMRNPKHRIHAILSGSKLVFDVQVKTSGYISEQKVPISQKKMEQLAEKEIEREIRQTFASGLKLHTDILCLSDSLYRRNPQGFHRWEQAGGMSLLDEKSLRKIQVKATIRDSGRTMLPVNHYKGDQPG